MVVEFVTQHPQTGAAADADALPNGTVVLNGADNAAVVTIANKTTGVYTATFTPPTLATGDMLTLRVAATVAAVAGKGIVWQQQAIPAQIAAVAANVDAIKLVTDDLNVSAVTYVAGNNAGSLTITAALTFDETVSGLTIPADWVVAFWTLKRSVRQDDDDALVQLKATNPAALTDGLQRLNGAAPVSPITAADGILTITQAAGTAKIVLSDNMTAELAEGAGIGYDIKFIDAASESTGVRGSATIVLTETKEV